jgi:hypothetical protein
LGTLPGFAIPGSDGREVDSIEEIGSGMVLPLQVSINLLGNCVDINGLLDITITTSI